MIDTREFLRRRVSLLAGDRPTYWASSRTSRGDFDGRDWTLELFDVPAREQRALLDLLWPTWETVSDKLGRNLRFVFHTPEATQRHHAWVLAERASMRLLDSAIVDHPRYCASHPLLGRGPRDVFPSAPNLPARAA